MNAKIRPLADLNRAATDILIREMGVVDTQRFLSQFRVGTGDYTKERGQWLGNLSLKDIVSQVKNKRRAKRRTSG